MTLDLIWSDLYCCRSRTITSPSPLSSSFSSSFGHGGGRWGIGNPCKDPNNQSYYPDIYRTFSVNTPLTSDLWQRLCVCPVSPLPLLSLLLALSVLASLSAAMASAVGVVRLWGRWSPFIQPTPDRKYQYHSDFVHFIKHFNFLNRKQKSDHQEVRGHSVYLYLWEECSDRVDSSSFSSSLHCLASSSEWTLITSLITCRATTVMPSNQLVSVKLYLNRKGVMSQDVWQKFQSNVVLWRSYLGVGLLGDVNVLGSIGLTPPLVVPHLCHQLQMSLWFVLFVIYTIQKTKNTQVHFTRRLHRGEKTYKFKIGLKISSIIQIIYLTEFIWWLKMQSN